MQTTNAGDGHLHQTPDGRVAQGVPFSVLAPRLKTGDLLLFSGRSHVSEGIKYLTASNWSHVGLLYRAPDSENLDVWEAGSRADMVDLDTGLRHRGVRRVRLTDRLSVYDGEAFVRPLTKPLDPCRLERLEAMRVELRGRAYEDSLLEMFLAAYDGPFGDNEPDLSTVFCSELVAETLHRLDVIAPVRPANEYMPSDFCGRLGREREPLHFLDGYGFGDEIAIEAR